ncbi:MAG: outer membrane beta-barrel protein [Candidatus Wallbacteria bacterium]|nr:outer membrane beta-barrel protein [Candidatus Wallbacteria bacterium]
MKKIALLLIALYPLFHLRADLTDYLVVDMKGREGIAAQAYNYAPADARDALGNRVDDWMFSVYYYHFNTKKSSIEFGVGLWEETSNGLSARIRPITIGMSFYENLENNFKFFYGADLGAFRLEAQQRNALGTINSYSDTDFGLQLKLGMAYLLHADFWAKGEIRYTGCTVENVYPTAPSDSDISDFNFAMSFIAMF